MWELLTMASYHPYENLTDAEVIENCENMQFNRRYHILDRPENCPSEIYDLMRQCWTRDKTQRTDV